MSNLKHAKTAARVALAYRVFKKSKTSSKPILPGKQVSFSDGEFLIFWLMLPLPWVVIIKVLYFLLS